MTTTENFLPYQAKPASTTREEVFEHCNRDLFAAYGVGRSMDEDKPVAYPMFAYVALLESLKGMAHIEVVPLGDLCRKPLGDPKVRLAIRHDVDGDIVAALQMAHHENRYKIPSSFYFLHTAPYHGSFGNGTFYRNECIAHVYREVQDLGHEVGLHTDGLTVYQQHGMDGAEAIVQEVEWLRGLGIRVEGTVAHGSASIFGAENFEIFKGRKKGRAREPSYASDEPEKLVHNGRRALLRVLNEDELGLRYEGNDVFWQKDVPVEYGATRTVDGWRWNAYLRRRRENPGPAAALEFCTQEEVLRDIAQVPSGKCIVLTVHPCYYGSRDDEKHPPLMRRRCVTTYVNDQLGWQSYVPGTIQCWSNRESERQAYQAINYANDLGLLDVPRSLRASSAGHRILFLGGENLDGREVAVTSQLPSVLRKMAEHLASAEVQCLKLAFPGMGVSRYWAWYKAVADRFRPTVVFLGIGSQELRYSVPGLWSVETGFSQQHPPGDYLGWEDGAIVEVPKSVGWQVRQRLPRVIKFWTGTETLIEQVMAQEGKCRLEGVDCWRYLRECYKFFADALRSKNIQGFLFITEAGEAAGWFEPSHEAKWRTENIARFKTRVAEIAEAASLPWLDPYEFFGKANSERMCHYPDRSWNVMAHRLAAHCVFQQLVKERILIPNAASP